MKVFISWSGPTSGAIAATLRDWLPSVIQAVRPFYSADDTNKGTRWNNEIANELSQSQVGLICLTRDNINRPWLMFEAGALSKNIKESRVIPLLFGLQPTDVGYPLATFQSAPFEKAHFKQVVDTINQALEEPLADFVIDNVFEKWWPDLEQQVQQHLQVNQQAQKSQAGEVRSERDLLEEILTLTREAAQYRSSTSARPAALIAQDLVERFIEVSRITRNLQLAPSVLMPALLKLHRPVDAIVDELIQDESELNAVRFKLLNEFRSLQLDAKDTPKKRPVPPPDDDDLPF